MKKLFIIFALLSAVVANAQQVMTLQECLESARTNNHDLQNAALDIMSATEQRKEVYTKYYPQISANVLAFRTFDKVIKGDGTIPEEIVALNPSLVDYVGMPYSFKELNRGYTATMSIVEPLYTGGQITTGNKLTKVQEDVMYLQRSLTEKDVLQKVTEHYWQIAIIKYNQNTISAAEKQLDTVLKQVELFVKTGVTTRNNLLLVKMRQKELESNKLKLENAHRLLCMLLAQEIGMAQTQIDIDVDNDAQYVDPQTVYIPSAEAVLNREELKMANIGVTAQKLQVKMERAKLMPTLAVGVMGYHAGFGGLSDGVKKYVNTSMTNGLVFGVLSVPISDWWGGSHAIKRQKIKLQQSKNVVTNAQELLCVDIESTYNNLVEAYKQIDIAQATVAEANENLRMSSEQYKVGKVTISDLLDAETLNRKAENDLTQAKAVYQMKLADYLRKVK